jgi:hypothetical protein
MIWFYIWAAQLLILWYFPQFESSWGSIKKQAPKSGKKESSRLARSRQKFQQKKLQKGSAETPMAKLDLGEREEADGMDAAALRAKEDAARATSIYI